MKNKYIIIDLKSHRPFIDEKWEVKIFGTIEDARLHCGMYELDNCWVCKLEWQHEEK